MFKYHMPTKIYFGENALNENYKEIQNYGSKALIVTGKNSSKKNGSLDELIKNLNDLSISYVIYDKVEENPSLETILDGSTLAKIKACDFVIGLGGGSPMDAAKAMAIYINNPDLKDDEIFKIKDLSSVPMLAIPTTSGTGSEVTQYSVITIHKEETKKNFGQVVFPKIAFIDPKYTYKSPLNVTINTAVDAFSHLLESYLNTNASSMSDGLCEDGFKLFAGVLDDMLELNITNKTRNSAMLMSTLAGMAIAQTGTSIPHGMGYAITYSKNLAHGKTNGMLMADYMLSFKDQNKVSKVFSLIEVNDAHEFKSMIGKLMPEKIVLTHDEIDKFTKDFLYNKAKLKNHTEEIGYDEVYMIYKKSFE
ncbi:MAG: iron-containing alcohol dehydrogenase family protein [Acidaminobacteraceae bacterium]